MQKEPAQLFFVEPMKCKPVESLPERSGDWQQEIKFDGYRAIAVKQRGDVDLYSRNENSFNAAYPEVVDAIRQLRGKFFILDGELAAIDEKGHHSFHFSRIGVAKVRAPRCIFMCSIFSTWTEKT